MGTRLKLMTGKVDISDTEARALVKESGNKAAGDFMKTCMEDSDGATLAGCLVDGRKAMGDATGNTFTDDAAGIREANKEFMGGLRESAKDEVADAFGACVKSKATVDRHLLVVLIQIVKQQKLKHLKLLVLEMV